MALRPRRNIAFKKVISAKPGKGSSSSMNDLLECPVCLNLMYPPIHQCCNGHSICYSCKDRVGDICPICRGELGNIRCLALEKVAEKLDLPCKFHVFGCPHILSYHNRIEHEKICTFCLYKCPYNFTDCSVTGDIKSIVAHLKENHRVGSVDTVDGSTFNLVYDISDRSDMEKDTWLFSLCDCFGHHFYIQFEDIILESAPVYMAFVRLMGNEREANKFRYYLVVHGKEERKMSWQGIPRSIQDSDTSVRNNLDGLIIHKDLALFLPRDRQEPKLKVALQIWRADDI